MTRRHAVSLAAIILLSAVPALATRETAVTVDDLPLSTLSPTDGDAAVAVDVTAKLLASLRRAQVLAVGFVNEQRLHKPGEVEQRIRCLRMWVDAGFELGNHTFSHPHLHSVGLRRFEDDVIRGEPVTRALLAEHHRKLRYFRHPFLETGRDLDTRRRLERFLAARGYTIAPVTVDPFDWMFSAVYQDAKQHGDATLEERVAHAYLTHLDDAFAFAERLAQALLGRDVKQVLLLHANVLNADHLDEALKRIRARGYRFVTLDDALTDAAYALPDTYVGKSGQTWLYHWAATRGLSPSPDRPPLPMFIVQRYYALQRTQSR